jgi:hypothetical protein
VQRGETVGRVVGGAAAVDREGDARSHIRCLFGNLAPLSIPVQIGVLVPLE